MKTLRAPEIDNWLDRLKNTNVAFNEQTEAIVDGVFERLHKIAPCGPDERRELWVTASRGTIDDYGTLEDYIDEDLVKTEEEFQALWLEEYPNEQSWYRLVSVEHDQYRAIFLGNQWLYEHGDRLEHSYTIGAEDLFSWLSAAVDARISDMEAGTYNQDVQDNLPPRKRTGTISGKDYWETFPETKEDYLKDITESEIQQFLENIKKQKNERPVGKCLDNMTARMFYVACSIGYRANGYDGLDGLTAKEKYYKKADGRDEGLSEIDQDSREEFDEWYNNRERWGGHPWEVCRGGNSTHIDLYISHDEQGYYYSLRGKSYGRSIETIKFYNALVESGMPVYLYDAEVLVNRLLGKDVIGIVPEHVLPVYCEGWFPDQKIADFINLPYEQDEYEKILPKVKWMDEKNQYLLP